VGVCGLLSERIGVDVNEGQGSWGKEEPEHRELGLTNLGRLHDSLHFFFLHISLTSLTYIGTVVH
jgi:hypothetical protein